MPFGHAEAEELRAEARRTGKLLAQRGLKAAVAAAVARAAAPRESDEARLTRILMERGARRRTLRTEPPVAKRFDAEQAAALSVRGGKLRNGTPTALRSSGVRLMSLDVAQKELLDQVCCATCKRHDVFSTVAAAERRRGLGSTLLIVCSHCGAELSVRPSRCEARTARGFVPRRRRRTSSCRRSSAAASRRRRRRSTATAPRRSTTSPSSSSLTPRRWPTKTAPAAACRSTVDSHGSNEGVRDLVGVIS